MKEKSGGINQKSRVKNEERVKGNARQRKEKDFDERKRMRRRRKE